ncbi:hypothetical protein M5J20_09735 [Corynebacterium sp. TA-R-1]|uniref:Secreted protein n=1 Tax=Corynebacterium stercoris TaxID=2943490 RepID=A0ABT1G367_9CORY|nr:hypothetical protein [Corynebacterium stercoris]MCP1388459.1 hypothetical protein [Corynebacterium stercoris]
MMGHARRALTAAAALCAAAGLTTALTPVVAALPVPVDPTNSEVAEQWANPAVRPGEGEEAELTLIDAPSSPENGMFHVKLRVTNRSKEILDGFSVTPRRGPATGSVWDQRVATVASIREYALIGERRELSTQLNPGEAVEFTLDITPETLPLPGTAAYPLLLQLTDSEGRTLDTERFHLAVHPDGTVLPEGARPGGLTALYPISTPVDILPGETGEAPEDPQLVLASEHLAEELAPGGRLDQLVDTYLAATENPEVGLATCAALDPALIDVADRMTRGYIVAEERAPAVEEPKRLRDSWGDDTMSRGTPGTGAADAARWLDKVRDIADDGCTVALPWANADLNAVARTGDPWLMREAIERGPFTLGRVLGTTGTLNTVVPGTGYVAEDTLGALGWADHSRSTIPQEGLSGSWERAVAHAQGDVAAPDTAREGQTSLEQRDLAAPAWAAAAPPETTVRVLMPDGAVDSEALAAPIDPETGLPVPQLPAERFAWVAPGIMAVGYQDSLAATLATVSPQPETAGYSNDAFRFDYALDSDAARTTNAAAAVQLAVQNAWVYEGQPDTEPVFVNPPAAWSADAAAALLGTVADLIAAGAARPVTFPSYITPPSGPEIPAATRVGTQFPDPTTYSDSEILAATQQARFINDLSALLVPDPSIALTRYGFTLPLRRDILTALSPAGRRSIEGYSDAVAETSARLAGSRETLGDLRSAVTLIPPGNVYTRTSPTSPLLIVARNGMPLPVDTSIRYSATDGSRLNVPDSLRIPARGSVTVQMTADLPQDARSANLQLYLAGPQGHAISQPVDISVRTPRLALRGWVLIAVGALVAALMLLYAVRKRRVRTSRGAPPTGPPLYDDS